MSDLISRSALLKEIRERAGMWKRTAEVFCEVIEGQPTVEAVPVVHGEWIHVPSSDMATGRAYECSNCKKMRYGSFLPPFCQMCGQI